MRQSGDLKLRELKDGLVNNGSKDRTGQTLEQLRILNIIFDKTSRMMQKLVWPMQHRLSTFDRSNKQGGRYVGKIRDIAHDLHIIICFLSSIPSIQVFPDHGSLNTIV